MSHTLVMLLAVLVGFTACEIHPIGTRAKIAALQKKARYSGKHKVSHHRAAAAQGMSLVTPQWLSEYHQLEAEHGGYSIPDDSSIHASPDGKIKVPHSVVKHFNDLSRAPVKPKEEE